jgi:hypothetical protein
MENHMARSPNDDRSDSMNPNNAAYDASERNRANQIGASDDDDYDDSPGRSSGSYFSYYPDPIAPASAPRVTEVELIIPPLPVRVQGLYLLIVSKDEKQRRIKVDAGAIEEAVNDAKAIWDRLPLAYLALYDKENIYIENSRSKRFSPDVVQSIVELEELEKLISLASDNVSSARRSLNSDTWRYGQQGLGRFLESYGSCYAALQGLRAERSERIEELHARGYTVTEKTAREFGQEGKLTRVVDANAQWVRDFQSGKATIDALSDAFYRPERILNVKP